MVGSVYILNLSNGQYYIGSTNNTERRLAEHNAGKTPSIKYKLPAIMVFHQEFESLEIARKIEVRLKKYKSRKIIEQIIKDGFIKN